jgi:iron complex transport system ATP-binding protein
MEERRATSGERAEKIIEVSGLSISLGGKAVLRDVSCDARRGDFLCVVGRNGAGKSTLFKCVCGAYKNFRGSVKLAGKEAGTMSARERARVVAYVPQSVPPDMPYTVHEFMEMSRYPWRNFFSSSREDHRAVSDAIALAGVEEFASRKMRDLSGGERQKVMIASAIAQESDAILMDEPTTFLDYSHQVETMELMTRVNKEKNVAMLIVTHDINLAMRVSDKVLGLSEGRVEWTGTPHGLQDSGLLYSIFGVTFERYFARREGVSPLFAPLFTPTGFAPTGR